MKLYISLMVLMTLVSSCTDTKQNGHTISVLEDRTETNFLARPDYESIYPLLSLDKDLWKAITFRYGSLTDLEHNKRYIVSIEREVSLFSNAIERKKKVVDFKSDVANILDNPQTTIERHHSSIWEPLIKEMVILQKDSLQQNTIYLFSDLQENATFSVYNKEHLSLLINTPVVIEELFLSKAKRLVSRTNLKVVVVYQPRTAEEDMRFKQMSELYSKVFNRIGVSIEFVANINTLGRE